MKQTYEYTVSSKTKVEVCVVSYFCGKNGWLKSGTGLAWGTSVLLSCFKAFSSSICTVLWISVVFYLLVYNWPAKNCTRKNNCYLYILYHLFRFSFFSVSLIYYFFLLNLWSKQIYIILKETILKGSNNTSPCYWSKKKEKKKEATFLSNSALSTARCSTCRSNSWTSVSGLRTFSGTGMGSLHNYDSKSEQWFLIRNHVHAYIWNEIEVLLFHDWLCFKQSHSCFFPLHPLPFFHFTLQFLFMPHQTLQLERFWFCAWFWFRFWWKLHKKVNNINHSKNKLNYVVNITN